MGLDQDDGVGPDPISFPWPQAREGKAASCAPGSPRGRRYLQAAPAPMPAMCLALGLKCRLVVVSLPQTRTDGFAFRCNRLERARARCRGGPAGRSQNAPQRPFGVTIRGLLAAAPSVLPQKSLSR